MFEPIAVTVPLKIYVAALHTCWQNCWYPSFNKWNAHNGQKNHKTDKKLSKKIKLKCLDVSMTTDISKDFKDGLQGQSLRSHQCGTYWRRIAVEAARISFWQLDNISDFHTQKQILPRDKTPCCKTWMRFGFGLG